MHVGVGNLLGENNKKLRQSLTRRADRVREHVK
jgi:hypothetical protein